MGDPTLFKFITGEEVIGERSTEIDGHYINGIRITKLKRVHYTQSHVGQDSAVLTPYLAGSPMLSEITVAFDQILLECEPCNPVADLWRQLFSSIAIAR